MSILHKHNYKVTRTLGFYSIRVCDCGKTQSLIKDVETGEATWADIVAYDLFGPIYIVSYNWSEFGGAKRILLAGDFGFEENQIQFLVEPAQVEYPKRPMLFFYRNWWENETYQAEWFSNYLNRYFSGE